MKWQIFNLALTFIDFIYILYIEVKTSLGCLSEVPGIKKLKKL